MLGSLAANRTSFTFSVPLQRCASWSQISSALCDQKFLSMYVMSLCGLQLPITLEMEIIVTRVGPCALSVKTRFSAVESPFS